MKRHILHLMVLAMSVAGAGCSLDESNREQMVDLQQVANDPDAQLMHLNAAIASSKRDASLYARRAIVYLKKGELELALNDAEEAVSLSKNDPVNFFVKAQVLRALDREEEALKLALQAERNSFHSPSLYVLLGDLYLKKQQYEQASNYINKALELSPVDEYALYYKGRVLAVTGDTTRAMQHYIQALEQDPSFMEPQREIAGVLVSRKEYAAARPYLEKVQKRLPNDGQVWYLRGLLYQGEQKQDSAYWSYNRALALSDSLPAAHYQLGMLLYNRGNNEGAIEHLEKAGKTYTRRLKYMSTLASSYERTGQFIKALEQYQRLAAAEPANTYVNGSISRLKSKLERPMPDSTATYQREL